MSIDYPEYPTDTPEPGVCVECIGMGCGECNDTGCCDTYASNFSDHDEG